MSLWENDQAEKHDCVISSVADDLVERHEGCVNLGNYDFGREAWGLCKLCEFEYDECMRQTEKFYYVVSFANLALAECNEDAVSFVV